MNFFYDFQSSLGRFHPVKTLKMYEKFKHIQEFFTPEKLLNFHDAEVFTLLDDEHRVLLSFFLKFLQTLSLHRQATMSLFCAEFVCLFRDVCLISDVWARELVFIFNLNPMLGCRNAETLTFFLLFLTFSRLTVDVMFAKQKPAENATQKCRRQIERKKESLWWCSEWNGKTIWQVLITDLSVLNCTT